MIINVFRVGIAGLVLLDPLNLTDGQRVIFEGVQDLVNRISERNRNATGLIVIIFTLNGVPVYNLLDMNPESIEFFRQNGVSPANAVN